jgi:hypothetical protein
MTTDSFCYALNRTARHYRYHRHMRALAADEYIHGHCLSFHGTNLTTNLIMDAIAKWHLFLSLYRSNCTRNFLYVLDLTLSVWLTRLFSLRSFGTVLAEVGVNITLYLSYRNPSLKTLMWDVVSASRRVLYYHSGDIIGRRKKKHSCPSFESTLFRFPPADSFASPLWPVGKRKLLSPLSNLL